MLLAMNQFSSNHRVNQVEQHAKLLTLALILLAFVLGLSSLNRGLQSDDFLHRYMLSEQNQPLLHTLNHFFEFLNPYNNIPWWSDEQIKIKFWRPLSAFTHWLDYQLWPNSPQLMHLHSVLWYSLLCFLVLTFFKRVVSFPLALMIAVIFTLDFNHFANLSWLANRNSLITACFTLLSLTQYLHWRQQSSIHHFFISLLCFIAALLAGEAGITLLAFIIIVEVLNAVSGKLFPKLKGVNNLALLAYLLIALLWFWHYQSSGFGVKGNSLYFSPADNPVFSVMLLLQKIPIFLFGGIFGIDGFFNVFPDEIKYTISLVCGLALFLFFYLNRILLRSTVFLFFLLAALASLIPVCFVAILDMRLSLMSSIFSAAMIALLIKHFSEHLHSTLKLVLFIYLIGIHGVVAASQWFITGIKDISSPPQPFSKLLDLQALYPQHTLYLLNYPSPIDGFYFPFVQSAEQKPVIILGNNFSNYELAIDTKNHIHIQQAAGLIFKNADFNHFNLQQKPWMHGVYARSAFNGVNDRDFKFTQGKVFSNAYVQATILKTTPKGLATHIDLKIMEERNFKLLYWNSAERRFVDLETVRTTMRVDNW